MIAFRAALLYSSEYNYMETLISAAEANRRFSEVLRTVKKGRDIVVTSHGRPVAKIVPITEEKRVTDAARTALFSRLKKQKPANIGIWKRDELYEDER
jgi:prevent-host-death family protein